MMEATDSRLDSYDDDEEMMGDPLPAHHAPRPAHLAHLRNNSPIQNSQRDTTQNSQTQNSQGGERPILLDYNGYYCFLYKEASYVIYCGVGQKPSGISETDARIYIPKFDEDERFLGFKNSDGMSLSAQLKGIISRSTQQQTEEYMNRTGLYTISLSNGTLTMSCPNRESVF